MQQELALYAEPREAIPDLGAVVVEELLQVLQQNGLLQTDGRRQAG